MSPTAASVKGAVIFIAKARSGARGFACDAGEPFCARSLSAKVGTNKMAIVSKYKHLRFIFPPLVGANSRFERHLYLRLRHLNGPLPRFVELRETVRPKWSSLFFI